MSSFTAPPAVRPMGNNKFKLLESFEYYYAVGKEDTESIIVPKGFVTDFASIPSALHWIINPTDQHIMKPAMIHDILYTKEKIFKSGTEEFYTRRESDVLMFDMMRIQGAPLWKLIGVYLALRAGGWAEYDYVGKGQKEPMIRKAWNNIFA